MTGTIRLGKGVRREAESVTAGAIIPKVPVENSPAPARWCYTRIDSIRRRCGEVLRGKDVHEVEQMKQMGLSVSAISKLTGYDRKTVRKYLLNPEGVPDYGPRVAEPSKLDPHKPFLADRLKAGVWNAQVLLREIRQHGYGGGYTILKDWLHPQRTAACTAAVRRFETPPGKQAQVDWGHLGDLEMAGAAHRIWGFTITLGYSRRMWAQAALDQKLGTLLRMHEGAFQEWGGVPEEILYDRMRTVWLGQDERGEIIWHPVFLDFARYWGFKPRLCLALSGADQREDRIGREVCTAEFRMRAAGAGARVLDGLQHGAAAVGGNGGQSARAWDHVRASAGALGRGSVCHAASERPAAVSLQRR